MRKMLWGSGTAAYQAEGAWDEGGKGRNIWDDFSHHSARNINHVSGDVAADHYHRFKEDLALLKAGNQNTYRFSIAWSRIFPADNGEVNLAGIAFYNDLLDELAAQGIVPNVTLYHYDLPAYLQAKGGWLNRATIDAFALYAETCFAYFGDRVPLWTTINEPFYSLTSMYIAGNYPPHQQDFRSFVNGAYLTLLASARVVALYKAQFQERQQGEIGIVADITPCYPADDSAAAQVATEWADCFYNQWVLQTAIEGHFPTMILPLLAKNLNPSMLRDSDAQLFQAGRVDFLGVNYYEKALIRPSQGTDIFIKKNNTGNPTDHDDLVELRMTSYFEVIQDSKAAHTDWGMEIHASGIYDVLTSLSQRYPQLPLYITENGLGHLEESSVDGPLADDYRISFLADHIDYILKAKAEGVDVRGYYVWASFDVYSWVNGYDKRYGLIHIDFDHDLTRTPKKSYFWYQELITQQQQQLDE